MALRCETGRASRSSTSTRTLRTPSTKLVAPDAADGAGRALRGGPGSVPGPHAGPVEHHDRRSRRRAGGLRSTDLDRDGRRGAEALLRAPAAQARRRAGVLAQPRRPRRRGERDRRRGRRARGRRDEPAVELHGVTRAVMLRNGALSDRDGVDEEAHTRVTIDRANP
jgi:hypothetical protein